MFPNLENVNKSSEYNNYDFSKEKAIDMEYNNFDPIKFYSIRKDINKNAFEMDSFVVTNYISNPMNRPYPFFPKNPYYNIFGDWNNKWTNK
jgi:hypothetical protein